MLLDYLVVADYLLSHYRHEGPRCVPLVGSFIFRFNFKYEETFCLFTQVWPFPSPAGSLCHTSLAGAKKKHINIDLSAADGALLLSPRLPPGLRGFSLFRDSSREQLLCKDSFIASRERGSMQGTKKSKNHCFTLQYYLILISFTLFHLYSPFLSNGDPKWITLFSPAFYLHKSPLGVG